MKEEELDANLRKHVTGASRFVDDQIPLRGMLEVWPVVSPHASALITRRDATKAREAEGIRAVLLAEDIPGLNHIGAIRDDEPLLADSHVFFNGQIIALVVGESVEACRRAADLVEVEYQPLPAVLTIEQAIAVSSYHTEAQVIQTGDCEGELENAPQRVEGSVSSGGQDHFSLETQVAWAEPIEGSDICVQVSSQHPSQIQALVADVLGKGKSEVRVESRRVGGGFGGKETQAHTWAVLAALAAFRTGAPVRVCLTRSQDMALTGKRHAFYAKYDVGFEENGRLKAVRISLYANGGWSLDLSESITERALLHLDSAYHLPNVRLSGRVCRTNLASNTSCLGSGVVEAALVIEEILDRVAFEAGITAEEVRRVNLYGRLGNPARTPYGQRVGSEALRSIWDEILKSSTYAERCDEIASWNRKHDTVKRGICIAPSKVGVGFPVRTLNQAGALVNVLTDGSVQVNHGGADSGQGINAKMGLIAAKVLGIRIERIRVMDPSTEKVPNTSATAVSSGCELNGRAVRDACEAIVNRMRPVAAQLLHEKDEPIPELSDLEFSEGYISCRGNSGKRVEIGEVIFYCWRNRISLSATGFYRVPEVSFDREKGEGRPFQYFSIGAAVSEVEIDGLTGQGRILRADIVQDAGVPVDARVDRSQIEGGFVMGMGWLTCEELLWDREGVLWTDTPSRYKVPTIGDIPEDFRVEFWSGAGEQDGDGGEVREVGESGVVLAISVRGAMKDALGAFSLGDAPVEMDAPATPESVYRAVVACGGWDAPIEATAPIDSGTVVKGETKVVQKTAAKEAAVARAGAGKSKGGEAGALPLKKAPEGAKGAGGAGGSSKAGREDEKKDRKEKKGADVSAGK